MTLLEGRTGEWEVVIGLEVHAQVVTNSKLFSGAATAFGAPPNTQVSLVDAAMPGMLPVINARAVEQAVRTGLGLKAEINLRSVFDRKNYFYPDLPQGYQISQFTQPIVGKGQVVLDLPDGGTRTVGITRLHLEQDAGKSIHDRDPRKTYVDLNRAGVALMEIVSEPDLRSAEEAAIYLAKLRSLLRYLGTCDGNMEEGSLRCDANVSVRKPGAALTTRCEIKNVNSIRFLRQAIDYEARRQIAVVEDGGEIVQETRLFDSRRGETRSMRSKEFAHDYRYFPDPDLLPLELDPDWVAKIKASLPELPDEKKRRLTERYSLAPHQAQVLVADREVADEFERIVQAALRNRLSESDAFIATEYVTARRADLPAQPSFSIAIGSTASMIANTTIVEVSSIAKESDEEVLDLLRRLDLVGLDKLLVDDVISGRIAKDVLAEMAKSKKKAADIVAEKGLKQVTDTGAIEAVVDQVLAANPKQAEQFRSGDTKVIGWLVGQVMKSSGGKANPKIVNEILAKKAGG